jgi:protein involved in polysaccharide export with SLBB domain
VKAGLGDEERRSVVTYVKDYLEKAGGLAESAEQQEDAADRERLERRATMYALLAIAQRLSTIESDLQQLATRPTGSPLGPRSR